ncbi:MAG: aldolase/citrate lyase family protein [Azospirillaceae bacterium]
MIPENTVRRTVEAGDTVHGVMAFEFFTPGLPASLAAAGAEYVILDMEHSGAGIETIKAQCALARGVGIVPLVRVPGIAYHLIAPVLDAGAMGIMAPMVETAAQAAELADACRYRPEGRRGLAFRVAHDSYATTDIAETMRAANDAVLVIALIESAAGIDNAFDILATPGIDVGWLGHYDLTDSLGIPGRFDHADFLAAADRLAAACGAAGKTAGIMDGDATLVAAMHARGYRMLGLGSDVGLLQAGYRSGLERVRAAIGRAERG